MAFFFSTLYIVLSFITSCFALYQLTGIPSTVVVGDDVNLTLTCTVDDDWNFVRWREVILENVIIGTAKNDCIVTAYDGYGTDEGYIYSCDLVNKKYFLNIYFRSLSEVLDNYHWSCGPPIGNPSKMWSPRVLVPVTEVDITPVGSSGVVNIKINDSLAFTCTTNLCRPAAWIQWYIGPQNVTNKATMLQTSNGTKFISTSTLKYTVKDDDHNKVVHCEAINIDRKQKPKTDNITLFVQSPVTVISITPVGINRIVSVIRGESLPFSCATDSGRPAAWIEWYIGEENITTEANSEITEDGTKFISTSTLNYIWQDADHNKTIYCTAVNIGASLKLKSTVLTAFIKVPVTNLTFIPIGNENVVRITKEDTQTFTCTTDSSRPAAWIQWYIGGKNVTNDATTLTTSDGSKFISTSSLNYTGKESDHNDSMYCEAVSFVGTKNVLSIKKTIYIRVPIESVTITTTESSNNVSVVKGKTYVFTCTTSPGRPKAWIQWYIGEQAVTDLTKEAITQVGTKFISTSTFNYTGKEADHNKVVYCDAVNIENGPNVTSARKTVSIKVPVSVVLFTPTGIEGNIYISISEVQTFQCETDSSRPAAFIQWFIAGKNVTSNAYTTIIPRGSKFTSLSTLNYTGSDSDHNKTIHCSAANIEGTLVDSKNKTLYIQLSVMLALIMPAGNNNVISVGLGRTQIFTCTTDASRPAALIQWFIGGKNLTDSATSSTSQNGTKFISNSKLNHTIMDADHNKVVYCTATNIKENKAAKSMNKTLYVIVPISSVTLSPTFMNKSVTVVSEKDFNFTCKSSASRPDAWIQWYIGGRNVTNRATFVISQNGTKFISTSYLYYTGKIADHGHSIHCEAVNAHDRTISPNESLYVLSRTTYDKTYDLEREVFIGTSGGLNLTVYLIANPKPDITWTFDSDQQKTQTTTITDYNFTSVDTFRHVTMYVKNKAVQSDFGNYTVKAGNGIESDFVHVFAVKPAQAPSPPFNLNAVCDQQIPFVNVSWFSNFNGGTTQEFHVVVRNMITGVIVNSSAQRDRGQNNIHFYESTYDFDSVYEIYVEAHNKDGAANSSDIANCTTKKEISQSFESSSAVIGGVAGSSVAVIAVAVIGLVVFIVRRQKNKGDEKQHLHGLNGRTEEVDENEQDGLKDNPLYGTSGVPFSAVQYAHARKLTKGKNPTGVKTRDESPRKKKGKQTERIELACVYENADDLRKDKGNNIYGNVNEDGSSSMVLPNNERKTKKNKDGLIYADLEFVSARSGKTFVIRGLENKTNYAMIDLSKKAEALPPDSDDDDASNIGQENIDNR